ncbi:molybdenum cofactor guanylyltransferase [Methanococcoides methylutens]|uniref:Probable molybdenum cofactor guanylyltransferase n=1 Tax=Methanococcoides methylutens MM1 TaxID=1434104 RepID=A0A0E3WZF0_METMT|nr:molybdenum cofactor guanylyltransferase [Methanococcoides methylutens]AKB84769.1 Molybdopterin-guanine dinucleotide biosynthesis protein MobA [Methanococcoides methylutens MM1]
MTLSALILAGGRGRRLGNMEKALMNCDGRSLLERTINILDDIVDEVLVSVRDEEQEKEFEAYACGKQMVRDSYSDIGPLAGILEGFRAAKGKYIFVTACDMPFIDPKVVEFMFRCAEDHDAAVPLRLDGSMEPLCGVYRVEPMLPLIEMSIASGKRFILAPVFELDDVVGVEMEKIREIDPELKTFININTFDDMDKLDICQDG